MVATAMAQSVLTAPQTKLGCNGRALRPAAQAPVPRRGLALQTRAAVADLQMVPDSNKRTIMNLLLVGAAGLPIASLAGPFVYFFVPKSAGAGSGGITAKDALGNDVKASSWIKKYGANSRSLTQGLKSDATYLIVNENTEIEKYGLNAVCTHLGCVVPWNSNENKFMCPCHGSQYNKQGKVIRGPAPLSLALAHCDVKDDLVTFSPWTETDFRTNLNPWWA